ncbi:hypothetical protein QCA50_003015 [Cerrena zonata]|uniref:Mitotic checkpoint regulator, MAD2B-interacting-domain-containing protein n=1 Tax=Cerrena zonata TaxID=2478898 RepID=A0AAW0GU00_9APHY
MLGVEDYGSDIESGDESTPQSPPPKPTPSLAAKLPPPKKSTFSLPPPSSSGSKPSSSGLSLPPPKKKAPKKITIGLPSLSTNDTDNTELDDRPPAKKPRLDSGAGSSGLLSMLPAPKNKAPVLPAPERVLGGGKGPGLVFKTAPNSSRPTQQASVEDEEDEDSGPANEPPSGTSILEEVTETNPPPIAFMPTSVKRGRTNISTEERHTAPKIALPKVSAAPAVDFFGLGEATSSSSRLSTPPVPTPSASKPNLPGLSSAPKVEEFVAPEPTPEDPYPGYYMLPSGSWAAYEPNYYKKFYDRWKREYDSHVRALEKGIEKGFEAVEREGAQEVNAAEEMERAKVEIQEREERKALTAGGDAAPAAPKMNIKGAGLSGRARTRHQLSSLLTEAYQNREALEERIAQGRRNRKEAGNKYGF